MNASRSFWVKCFLVTLLGWALLLLAVHPKSREEWERRQGPGIRILAPVGEPLHPVGMTDEEERARYRAELDRMPISEVLENDGLSIAGIAGVLALLFTTVITTLRAPGERQESGKPLERRENDAGPDPAQR